jgi:hypothetical protein
MNQQQVAKILVSHDVDRWKKKFYLVFTRERGTLDLSLNPQKQVDLSNMTLNPESPTRVGDRILKSNYKFWVIYLYLISERLNDFAKATLRTRLFGNPETGAHGLFTEATCPQYHELIKHVGPLIDADKLEAQLDVSKEHLPAFGVQETFTEHPDA